MKIEENINKSFEFLFSLVTRGEDEIKQSFPRKYFP